LSTLPFNEEKYRAALGAPELFGETGYTTLERVWARPTCEVNGMLAGFTGEGAKTVIPAVAMAKVSMRLVPDQDPETIADRFEAYVKAIAPRSVDVTITRMPGAKPWTMKANRFLEAAARALEKGFGARPVLTREGGSNPIVSVFEDVLCVPIVLFDIGLPSDNAHAPNEKIDLANFHGGTVAAAYLYDEIARSASGRRITSVG
jgi:acetylornithine deacetylase/succinyl-diaminopimelate desuccinylase-like protein